MEAIGFKVNPYDNCMANKMVRDKQMTINWHVDGLKVYHADKDIVDAFIQRTKETYQDVTKIKASRGKIYYYIYMKIYYTTSVEGKIYIKEYIDK